MIVYWAKNFLWKSGQKLILGLYKFIRFKVDYKDKVFSTKEDLLQSQIC